MPVINDQTREAWQKIADELSKSRPSVGRTVRIVSGKRKGFEGIVLRHQRSKFDNAFRYASEAQAHMREMAGRLGFCILIRTEKEEFWTSASNVEILS